MDENENSIKNMIQCNQLEDLIMQVKFLKTKNDNLNSQLNVNEEEYGQLNNILIERKNTIDKLEKDFSNLSNEKQNAEITISEQEVIIEKQNVEINSLKQQNEKLTNSLEVNKFLDRLLRILLNKVKIACIYKELSANRNYSQDEMNHVLKIINKKNDQIRRLKEYISSN